MILLILGSMGCSKVNPSIESAESVSSLTLNKTVFSTKHPESLDLAFSGTCDKLVTSFQVADATANWRTPQSLGGTVTNECQDKGSFTIRIPALGTALGAIGALAEGASGPVMVRGVSDYGSTSQASLQITHLTSAYTIRGKTDGTTSMAPGSLSPGLKSNPIKPQRVLAGGYKIRAGLR